MYIIRNLPVDPKTSEMTMPSGNECGLAPEDCKMLHASALDIGEKKCNETGYWFSSNGHVVAVVPSKKGDVFTAVNIPAHIQGTPAIFELRISAWKQIGPDRSLPLSTSLSSSLATECIDELLRMVRDDSSPEEVEELLRDNCFSITHQNSDVGVTAIELLNGKACSFYADKPERLRKMCDLLCINGYAHESNASAAAAAPMGRTLTAGPTPASSCCWCCKAALDPTHTEIEEQERLRVLNEDESLFGVNIQSVPPNETFENASRAALMRGVDIRWLEQFTNMHQCWAWPTWRVVANIIKPATAHSRVRYIHLPGVSTAARIGKVDIFLSHAWGGIW